MSSACTALHIVVLTPMPRAKTATTESAKPGERKRPRNVRRNSGRRRAARSMATLHLNPRAKENVYANQQLARPVLGDVRPPVGRRCSRPNGAWEARVSRWRQRLMQPAVVPLL